MTHIIIFNAMLLTACLYALWAGGAPERATALVFLAAASSTFLLPFIDRSLVDPLLAVVDLLTLVALTGIALKANRYWPLYESALQLITFAIHGVRIYQPDMPHWMFLGASGKLAYPTLILLAIGVARHRERVRGSGSIGHGRSLTPHRLRVARRFDPNPPRATRWLSHA